MRVAPSWRVVPRVAKRGEASRGDLRVERSIPGSIFNQVVSPAFVPPSFAFWWGGEMSPAQPLTGECYRRPSPSDEKGEPFPTLIPTMAPCLRPSP